MYDTCICSLQTHHVQVAQQKLQKLLFWLRETTVIYYEKGVFDKIIKTFDNFFSLISYITLRSEIDSLSDRFCHSSL